MVILCWINKCLIQRCDFLFVSRRYIPDNRERERERADSGKGPKTTYRKLNLLQYMSYAIELTIAHLNNCLMSC